ncbi:MAG TPA: NUDIX domain-containing protein [Saprospiraceae bacterium]|jgi:8-oxo-dGTP pyrophosphatase MutT (NUDIX family)
MQRYKIYINESPLILTQISDLDDETAFERSLIHAKYRGKPKMLVNYIELLEKNKHHDGIIIQADNVLQLWKDFKSLYFYIKAGGGLVINPFGKVLLIFRRGVWDLPKGKQDPGETLAQTAVREVHEETGLSDLKLIERLDNGYHCYLMSKQRTLKRTRWYLMETQSPNQLVLQKEEGIQDAAWFDPKEIPSLNMPMYNNIRDVLVRYNNEKLNPPAVQK